MNHVNIIIIILICVLLICVVILKISNQKEHYIFIYAKVEPYYDNIFKTLHDKLINKYEPLLYVDDNIELPPHITLEYLTHYIINDNHNIIKTIRAHFTNVSNVHAIYTGIGCFILKNKIVIKVEFDSEALESIPNMVSSKIPEVETQREYKINEFRKVPSKIMKLYPNYTYNSALHLTLLNVNPFIGQDKLNEIIFLCEKYLSNHGIYKLQHIQIKSIEYINTPPRILD
jgi:hypothetical protein